MDLLLQCRLAMDGQPQGADVERSIELGQKALLLDDSNCAALALLSNDYVQQGQFDSAVTEGEPAVNINPNCSIGETFLAIALNAVGRPAEALRAIEKAMRVDPAGSAFHALVIANSYMLMGRYQEAIPLVQRRVGLLARVCRLLFALPRPLLAFLGGWRSYPYPTGPSAT
jgi:tetratricopeptide (TPR) repeat protein